MKRSQLRVSCHHQIQSSPIACSHDSFHFFMKIWDKNLISIQEQTCILYANASNEVIEWKCLTTGTCSETLFDIKLAVGIALSVQASKIIIGHNHPSGILRPSKSDIAATEKLKKACELMDIKLDDHLIIGRGYYYSFADNGLL